MDFADFYRATSPRLLRYAYGMTGDLPLAQDVTQEAYARAWQRWRSVSRHHDIEAWLRVVVTRLIYDWWRRLGIRRSRFEQPQTVPAPSENAVLLSAALKQLPRAQAQALALHYLLDLPIAQIAAETGVAEGTVKSWLSRGRAGLTDLLRDETQTADLVPAQDIQDRGTRRRRTRVIVAVVIGLALVAGLALWQRRDRHPQPVTPSPSPTALQRITGLDAQAPLGNSASVVAIAHGRGYAAWSAAGGDGGRSAVVTAIDLASGLKLWSNADVPSSAEQIYAGSDVVMVYGSPDLSDMKEVTALGPDGRLLWHQSITGKVRLFPFQNVLILADRVTGLSGLDWRTGQAVWRRAQPMDDVVVMHSAANEESEVVRPLTESGELLVISFGTVIHVDVTTGRDLRSWTGVPKSAAFRSYAAYEGKLYAAADDRLTTVDLGGDGPSVDYTEPAGRILDAPQPCFRTAVCVTVRAREPLLLVIRGSDVVFSQRNVMAPTMAAGNSLAATVPAEGRGVFVAIHSDPTEILQATEEQQGAPLWVDDRHILLYDQAYAVVEVDPATGVRRTLGTVDPDSRALSTDGRYLIAATYKGAVAVYRVTQ